MAGRGVPRQRMSLLSGRLRSPGAISFVVALLLHALVLFFAVLFRLPDPPSRQESVEVRLYTEREARTEERRQTEATVRPREEITPPIKQRHPDPSRPLPPSPERATETADAPVLVDARQDVAPVDSSHAERRKNITSVLDRSVDPERAWEVLDELLRQYPQYRESVVREMIAGSGLMPDTLTRADLRFDAIFQKGIKPSWGRQREVIEQAFRSYDPVMGWTNKGGYGPAVNVLGLLKFLIDLIEGED